MDERTTLLEVDTTVDLILTDTEPPPPLIRRLFQHKWTIVIVIVLIAIVVVSSVLVYAFVYSPSGSHLVVLNGKIYTASQYEEERWAEAMVVNELGVIIFVGTSTQAKEYVGRKSQVVDLQEKLVLPGFVDSHVHPVEGGVEYQGCVLYDAGTVEEVLDQVSAYVAAHAKNAWIVGAGWSLSLFANGNPNKSLLDNITNIPVFLLAFDGHSAWVNSAALAKAFINKSTPDPPGGRIERDPTTGEPSGTLREAAIELFDDYLPEPTDQDYINGLKLALKLASSYGITSMIEANADASYVQAYKEVLDAGGLTARMTISLNWDESTGVQQIPQLVKLRQQAFSSADQPLAQIKAVKLFLDGVLESETAALLQPYIGTNYTGEPNFDASTLNKTVLELSRNGFQVHMHAIGDAAIRMGFDAVSFAQTAFPKTLNLRHHLAHIELFNEADIPRFKELSVVANFQPFWSITNLTLPVIGPQRSKWLYPFESVWNTSAVCACGSDWSVTSLNPLDGIQNAVTRKLTSSSPSWLPHQRSTVEQAVLCYTRNSAYVAYRDDIVGVIDEGKLADFIVLDKNIFTIDPMNIGDARVMYTYLGGKLIYDHIAPSILIPGG